MPDALPGNGFFGWLGRQVGHVRRAIRTSVGEKKIYENCTVEEAEHPSDPNITLRRTTIDQAIQHDPQDKV
jgi:hypothetical protein